MFDDKKKISRGSNEIMREHAGGVRDARMHAIKSDILNNLRQQAFSIHGIASRHGVSISFIRQLFTAEGTSFAKFVLQQRLALAYRMLGDARFADRTVNAIAFEVGFGDVSYFNRAFRRRYGVKPSDMRETARLAPSLQAVLE